MQLFCVSALVTVTSTRQTYFPHFVYSRSLFVDRLYVSTITSESNEVPLDILYPLHAQALRKARIAPNRYPTLQELTAENTQVSKKSRK
jgi:hypothetical protein